MRTFLVKRFTALTFWLLFSQVKSNIKEMEYLSHTMASPFNFKCFLRSKNEKEEILRQAQNDKIRKTLSVKLNKTYVSIVVKDRIDKKHVKR
ncbi:hypothetical protein [Empedobacter falsenii]|uniref:Uncharacterized protein n=1 Tax=Empedobacter falsenii TaxID=343874 RepID=A0A7H9DSZ6_9FLAO|nr:hypothetical protein [Empedobacter falsenii]QLL57859.1 hypothetical protein FH779_07110 [Empedobacter falsenii]